MNHRERVDAWLGVGFARLPHEQKVAALERGFSAMWFRASNTLGEVTLAAIGERVLSGAREAHPFLAGVRIERDGLHCEALRDGAGRATAAEMHEAVRWLLVEILTLLGNLTADIMTPALHDALGRATLPKAKPKPDSESKSKSKSQQSPKKKPAPAAARTARSGRSRSRGKTT